MSESNLIKCKLLKKEISMGLCQEIFSVSCKQLKREAVKEIDGYTQEEIEKACESCPYTD